MLIANVTVAKDFSLFFVIINNFILLQAGVIFWPTLYTRS